MGGFSLPGLAPEPISGDSLTQYLRSLTNFGGASGTSFLNSGAGITNAGIGTVGQGTGQLNTAFGTTQPAVDYWSKILSGDPAALTAATAPTASMLSNIYSGATNNVSQNNPAGGFRSATLAQLPQAQASQVGNYMLGLQPQAAQQLNQLAGTQAGIGSATASAGLGVGGLGLGTSGIGSSLLQQTLNALMGRRGQNATTDTANLGMLTGGLESLVGAASGTSAVKSLSDIDAKHGIIPLGDYMGVPVYAWRYKDSGELAMGVIAQEVREVVPHAVSEGRDGFLRVDYDLLFSALRFAEAA